MSNFVIESREAAIEAAQQYRELGLPLPTDLVAYLTNNGVIATGDLLVTEQTFTPKPQD